MTMRRKWAALPGLLTIAATAALLSAYQGASSPQGRAPEQPIAFPHPLHAAGSLNLNCLYCHYTANKSPTAGLPAVETCYGCHRFAAIDRPEVQKIATYVTEQRPIPWVRVHNLPDYVQFPHMRHVNAGVSCQTCHGPVQEMTVVYQAESLNMGWCVDCHIQNRARYDCAVCHY